SASRDVFAERGRPYGPLVRNFRLLARPNFGLLWSGGLISFIGDWVLYIGMPISIYQITGSALATTLMFASSVVPNIVLGSVAGPPIGGVVAAAAGIAGVAVLDAVTFLAAAALVALMRVVPATTAASATIEDGVRRWRKLLGEWLDGLRLVWADRVVRTLFLPVG